MARLRNRIVLADPPNPSRNPYGTAFPNLGILYLVATLRRAIPNLDIYYIEARHSRREHLSLVETIAPCVYGLSFASPFAGISLQLMDEVKSRCSHTYVVCGGAHPTADPVDVLKSSHADVCCMGEGEKTFVEVVKAVLSGGDFSTVAGIACRSEDRGMHFGSERPLIADLDEIPFPAWDLINFDVYPGCRKSRGGVSTAIVASRGCPFNCTFCSNPVWKLRRPWLRKRSPENIAGEVELLYDRGVREIYLRSDEMNPDHDWCISVFDALSALNHPDLHFQCNLRVAPVTSALAESMSRARCWLCHLGVESGSQRVLNGVRKHITLSQVERACDILKSNNVRVYAFMMLYQAWEEDGVLQIETTREVFQSMRLILRLRRKGLVDHTSWSLATPYPGSELYQLCVKYDLIRDKKMYHRPVVITPHDITTHLPGVSKMSMAFARSLGLLLQGLLFISSRESYRKQTLMSNLRHALVKLKYILGFGK
jgi:anaerobic magnesium-protoporphyrin IX monomethyl ester cyclase